jgi:hypothetical protein
MLNEGRGISDSNKKEIERIFLLYKTDGYRKDIPFKLHGKKISISFLDQKNSSFSTINNKWHLSFGVSSEYSETRIREEISHELNHFIELVNLENKDFPLPSYNKVKRALLQFTPSTKLGIFFKFVIYKTLDNEINANVAQTYSYLKSFREKSPSFLKKCLNSYSLRKDYENITNFNIEKMISDFSVNKGAFDELVTFNQILISNGVGEFYKFVSDFESDKDLKKYIESWFYIIKKNSHRLLDRQENIIKEVIEDLITFENYSTEEFNLMSYEDYKDYKDYLNEHSI